ncbi:MAG: MBOAT family protein, partial [Planctomycetes bacterium]|nr:MBOAT family protein [Planctomycetota bacterium]
MLFHTWPFLLFFVVAYTVYLALRKTQYWLHWLLAASYFFYGWWNPLYLLLIVYSTALDYGVVNAMDRGRRKKLWLWISIANNLALLGFFKYAGFVTDNINALLTQFDLPYYVPAPGVLLPVGISFYTFQSMSYTIDFYRGQIEREKSFVRFAAFVSLFPQLVAGPIERARQLLPQLHRFPKITTQDVTDGMSLFVVGLFKKVALADYLGMYVDPIYATPDRYGSPALMLATFAFAWQIYFDFSGYTDMARGVARAMGIRLMLNFNNPYLATSLGDFWSRWHISLSTWFRDYVYIPLGGNRIGGLMTYRNLLLTMVIS